MHAYRKCQPPYAPPLALFTPTHPHPHTHSPQEPPVLNVLIPVTHPAVDPIGRVRTGAVSAWVYGSSQLVAAVSEALAVLGAKVVDTGRAAGGWVGVGWVGDSERSLAGRDVLY